MANETLVCGLCDADAAVVVVDEKEIHVGQRSTVVEVEFARCRKCGEDFFLPGQMAAAQEAASAKIREEEGLLQPEKVRAIRKKYDLTQEQFESLIGAGPKTVTRWETGKVFQNSTVDEFLRVLDRFPYIAAYQARRHGVQFAFEGAFSRGAARKTVALGELQEGGEYPTAWLVSVAEFIQAVYGTPSFRSGGASGAEQRIWMDTWRPRETKAYGT